MSLVTNVSDLATRIATEVKSLRILINGNVADLSDLNTTDKTNLVNAINEVLAAAGGTLDLDDISDVDVAGSSNGDFLRYDTGTWVNNDANGVAFELVGLTNLGSHSDMALGAASTGDLIRWNGSAWANMAEFTVVRDQVRTLNIYELNDVDTETTPPTDGQALVWDDGLNEWIPGDVVAALSLDDITDVNAPTPADGDLLTYDLSESEWVNIDRTDLAPVLLADGQLVDLGDVVFTGLASGDLIRHNGTTWVNVALSTLTPDASATVKGIVELATDAEAITGTDTVRATTPANVRAAIDDRVAAINAMIYKGVIDASANPNYPAADAGHMYIISVAGKIGGASGPNVEVGDMIICKTDGTASGNEATVGTAWNIIQRNIDGAVTGPASAANNNLATYDGTSGKIIKDSGIATSIDGTMASNSDAKVPTEKAVVTYAQPKDTELTALAGLTSAADKGIQFTGSGTAGTFDLTAAGKALLDDADATAQRATLGLVIGTNVQAQDAELAAIAGLTSAANKLPYFTGSGTAALADFSSYGRTIANFADAAAARTSIDVYSKTEIGDPTTNFVTTFEAGLV